MNNDDYTFIVGAVTGLFFGLVLTSIMYTVPSSTKWSQATQALEDCEQNLPRSEFCVITAAPDKGVQQ
jgi:hypothetical protein